METPNTKPKPNEPPTPAGPPCSAVYEETENGKRWTLKAAPPGCPAVDFYERTLREPGSMAANLQAVLAREATPDRHLVALVEALWLAIVRRDGQVQDIARLARAYADSAKPGECTPFQLPLSPSSNPPDPVSEATNRQHISELLRLASLPAAATADSAAQMLSMYLAARALLLPRVEHWEDLRSRLRAAFSTSFPCDPEQRVVTALRTAGWSEDEAWHAVRRVARV